MLLKQLLKNVEFTVVKGSLETEITDIIYDSRKASQGCVFVCIKGFSSDGHSYAESAVNSGAAAVVISEDIEISGDVSVIKVEDARAALSAMSAQYFGNPAKELTTVAITGTKGKTTTAAMIRSILEKSGIKTGTIGTLGIVIGDNIYKTRNTTPESYEVQQAMRRMINEGCKAMVIEASSLGLKWHRVDGITFDIGVFTNFSNDHIGVNEHKDMEEYLYCKSLLFRQCRLGIVNADDPVVPKLLKNSCCRVFTYGIDNPADYCGANERLIAKENFVGVHFDLSGKKSFPVDVPIPGRFSVYNALAAIAVCDALGVESGTAEQGMREVRVRGRVEPVPTDGEYTLLIDYAHNALSMENLLNTLREYHPNRLITLFGAGGNRPKSRRCEMGEVSGRLSDISVITEDNSRFEDVSDIIADIVKGVEKSGGSYVIVENRVEAIRYCLSIARKRDIIVLAGKGHEDYQEIKGVRYHLDEREVVAKILEERKSL